MVKGFRFLWHGATRRICANMRQGIGKIGTMKCSLCDKRGECSIIHTDRRNEKNPNRDWCVNLIHCGSHSDIEIKEYIKSKYAERDEELRAS